MMWHGIYVFWMCVYIKHDKEGIYQKHDSGNNENASRFVGNVCVEYGYDIFVLNGKKSMISKQMWM